MNGRMKKNGYNFRAPFRASPGGQYVLDALGVVVAQFPNGEQGGRIVDGGRFVGTAAEVLTNALNAYCAAAKDNGGEARVWCKYDPTRKCVCCEGCADEFDKAQGGAK